MPEATQHLKDYRPWGWFENIVLMPNYQVKRLQVYPKASLSLQNHKYRSEHWVVANGEATVILDKEEFKLKVNQSIFIKAGQNHKLSNLTKEPLILVEVQTGSYFGEDDIIRISDVYNRVN